MTSAAPTIFLSDEAFDLLVRQVPHELLQAFDVQQFATAIGTSRERFEFIVTALGAEARTQALIGQETAGYLRNALAVTLLALEGEFTPRTGADREEAAELLRGLDRFLAQGPAFAGVSA